MLDLQELKQKYPLAFDTIKLPVSYDKEGHIFDANGDKVADIRGWGHIQYMSHPVERLDQIGELICHLLNQLQ